MIPVIARNRDRYFSQRDNVKPYWISDGFVWSTDSKGETVPLFEEKDLEKRERELFDRSTRCFMSSGTMFSNSLWKGGLLPSQMDEIAYEQAINENLAGKEDRFFWSAHERVIDILIGHTDFDFRVIRAKENFSEVKKSIDLGFPVICSIWIKPYYPSGKGHIVCIVGYAVNDKGEVVGYYLDDPFGNVLGKYKDTNGEKVFIPSKDMDKLLDSPPREPRMMGLLRSKK